MKKPSKLLPPPRTLRPITADAHSIATGGALNPYLKLSGQKTGDIKG